MLMAVAGPVLRHRLPDLPGGDFSLHAGQRQTFVAGGLHRAGLMNVDVPAVGAQNALPRLESRINDGKICLRGSHEKMYIGIRRITQPADECPGLLTVIVHTIAGGLFQIGL